LIGLIKIEDNMDLNNQIELELYFADHFDTILFPVLAKIYFDKNDISRARKVCDIGLKYNNNDAAGLFLLANIEKVEGNLKKAEKLYENVLLYSPHHLSAALELCEIQTILGRAKSRLLKSWKYVLRLDPNHKTAQDFILKIEGNKKPLSKGKKQTSKSKKIIIESVKNSPIIKKKDTPSKITIEEYSDPLKISPRLATFTLVSVLKNQGLFSQALEVLDELEKKGESKKLIALERDTIEDLIQNLKKE